MVSDAGYDRRAGVEDESATVRHGAELSFVFSQPDTDNSGAAVEDMAEPVRFGAPVFDMRYLTRWVSVQVRLADMVVAYFTNFAKTGDPNGVTDLGQQLPTWPQTRGSDPSRPAEDLVLRVAGADEGDITVLNEYHGEACEYWCALPCT